MNNIEEMARKMAEQMLADMLKKQQEESIDKISITDDRLKAKVDRIFEKLNAYFPEHKVFALDSIDSKLRENLSEAYKQIGYKTVDEMLKAYGYEIISGDEVKKIRSFVLYTPGNEPDIIKPKVESMLRRLEEYYPNHIVNRGMQGEHKKLSQSISGLYQWLGYESAGEMLRAYGYKYNVAESGSGRPANDFHPMLEALIEKYKDGPKPKSMGDLLFENPELKGPLKTLQNKATELFGMTLKKYFQQVGIFGEGAASRTNYVRTTSEGINESAIDLLRERYENVDESIYGTVEEAIEKLAGMNVKSNKSGQIYIFRAVNCSSEVVIPYGIDYISDGAFADQKDIEKVTIYANIKEIPAKAFRGCTKLNTVIVPQGLVSIGEESFSKCLSMTSIELPESLQKIEKRAFAGNIDLKNVELQSPRIIVEQDAFKDCEFEYVAEKELGATEAEYFQYSCDKKGNITITRFSGTLENVVIPSVIDGHPVCTIGKGAFQDNKYLVELSMPDFITTMQGDAFRDCISLKKIHLSESISKIITTTFNGCIRLEEVNIPDEVTEIKRSTFKDSPLKVLHIGKSLASLDARSFYNGEYDQFSGRKKSTRAINKITINPENPYLKISGASVLSKDGRKLMAYLGNSKHFAIPEGVETIEAYAFEDLEFLSDVTLPESLVEIGEKAFSNTSIRSVVLSSKVKEIKNDAFSACSKLSAIVLNEGLEIIGDKSFEGCPIASVEIPSTVKLLGKYSFSCISAYYGSEHKQTLKIHPSNPYIKTDGKALYNISGSEKTLQVLYDQQYRQYSYDNRSKNIEYSVDIGTTHIAERAFGRCTSLNKVILPDGLKEIAAGAFSDCENLKEVVLPDSLEKIGEYAFKGTSIKEFRLGSAVCQIGEGAFITGNEWQDKRTKLRNIKVDKENTTFYVDKKALYKKKEDGSCAIFTYFGGDEIFALSEEVTEICEQAFARSIIQEIQIPSSVKIIGEQAFSGCGKLIRLKVGFSEVENGISYAVVYIPEISSNNYYTDSTIHDQFMDCIRVDGDGNVFDFVEYDSLFETITKSKDKILVATDRLKSAIQLVPLYREKYLTYLRRNAKKAVEVVVEFDDLSGLNTLAELNVFTGKNIDSIIELANKAKKPEILSYLMNYKNSNIGITEENYDL